MRISAQGQKSGKSAPFGAESGNPENPPEWDPWAMFKSLYKIPYSNFFSRILLLGLEHDLGRTSKKKHPVYMSYDGV